MTHTPTPWRVDSYSDDIYSDNVPKGTMRVADIRGWGYLTGKGAGALGLPVEEAIAIQKANAAFIVKAVNSHEALVKALEGIAEFCSSDATTLGAIERLAHIRNTAVNVLAHVGGAKQP